MSEQRTLKILDDFASTLEAAAVNVKRQIAALAGADQAAIVKEETFTILKWEPQEGAQIGTYEVAYRANNLPDKWTQAHNVLRQSNATINSRYHGQGYLFSYWLYGQDKIYRQKLKQA